MNNKVHTPFTILLLLFLANLLLGQVSRVLFYSFANVTLPLMELGRAMIRGIAFDIAVASYVSLPFAFLSLLPGFIWSKKYFQKFLFGLFYVAYAILSFSVLCEIFFVKEFNARFNFIAVDYLVYTNEVIRNIWESYPVYWIIPLFLGIQFLIAKYAYNYFAEIKFKSFLAGIFSLLSFVIFFFLFTETKYLEGIDLTEAEFSKNPVHALFSAYNNNEIDFNRFYATIGAQRAEARVSQILREDSLTMANPKDPAAEQESLARKIANEGPEKKLNVVIVLMESMSARFMKYYGAENEITPNLDRFAREGLFFNRLYSTGTRTVRGIEAVVLSLPPTPGQSVIRRPNSDGLFNISTVFRERGYSSKFIYGGHAVFDNMKNFYASNGFEVLDQSDMPKEMIHFANAWGVCDEDLFDFAIHQADESQGKPFFQFILTTSNHRPYTYPEGKIDIPSRSGRDGAVKYSDYSIGKFVEKAKAKPWFKDTIFIFVADHNAAVAGGTKILPYDYRIPMIFYAPEHIAPKQITTLGSQIDLAPTLFGLLNFTYESRFFGHDLLRTQKERAFLANYQSVGRWAQDKMVLLSPNRKVEIFTIKDENPTLEKRIDLTDSQSIDDPNVLDTIAYYETASDWFTESKLKEEKKSALTAQK